MQKIYFATSENGALDRDAAFICRSRVYFGGAKNTLRWPKEGIITFFNVEYRLLRDFV